MTATSDFFMNLAYRMHKENDLSDVTWAMCQSSALFREKFVSFFFKELSQERIFTISREIADENDQGSRVDFLITALDDPRPYLIEVKIWDTNHHFGQYEEAYGVSRDRLGYITNYRVSQAGYEIKSWEEFYLYLKEDLVACDSEDQDLIAGYLAYVRTVCGIVIFNKAMDLKSLYGLYQFEEALDRNIPVDNDRYSVTPYTRVKNIERDNGISGRYYEVEYKKSKGTIYMLSTKIS